MITIPEWRYNLLLIVDWVFIIYTSYLTYLLWKARWDKTQLKKFKKICKWEFRDETRMIHLVIKEFIDKYTQEHKIDWDEYI